MHTKNHKDHELEHDVSKCVPRALSQDIQNILIEKLDYTEYIGKSGHATGQSVVLRAD